MEQGFIDILQKLIAEQGKEILLNASKCKALLADYTRGEYKKESRLLLQALDAGVQEAIDAADDLAICERQQVSILRKEYSLAEKAAVDVVAMLALVLRGDTTMMEMPGKEIASSIEKRSSSKQNLTHTKKPRKNTGGKERKKQNFESRETTIINIHKLEAPNSIINIAGHYNHKDEIIFEILKNKIEEKIDNEEDKNELLSYVSEMEKRKNNKVEFRSYYEKFINRLGTYMSIFGPLLPYLVAYLE